MKTICCLFFLLSVPLALAQVAPAPVDLADPGSLESDPTCLADCERVFADCKAQCENSRAEAHQRHFETPDLPPAECVANCGVNLELCKEDC